MKRINVDWLGKNRMKATKRCENYAEKVGKLRKEKGKHELRTVL